MRQNAKGRSHSAGLAVNKESHNIHAIPQPGATPRANDWDTRTAAAIVIEPSSAALTHKLVTSVRFALQNLAETPGLYTKAKELSFTRLFMRSFSTTHARGLAGKSHSWKLSHEQWSKAFLVT